MELFNILNKKGKASKNIAKERLKLVLVHDRTNCSPHFLSMVKEDIIKVIADYMEIDEEGLDIKIVRTKSGADGATVPALVANIPIKKMKDRRR
ncbi:MAG: cell division topological specificity factor MinE [Clostridiales bacterium]|nr:cell division topological specificity factor MinE [Clostridiales bacterium]